LKEAAYEAVVDPAWAAYEAVRDPALAAYEAVVDPAWAAYEAVVDPALAAAYEAVVDPALAAAYEAVRGPLQRPIADPLVPVFPAKLKNLYKARHWGEAWAAYKAVRDDV
jgi:hypothetical protein